MHRPLILRRTTRPDSLIPEDFDVICDGAVVGRVFFTGDTSPRARAWFWGLAYGHIEDRIPTHGYEPTREAAMAAFRRAWDRSPGTKTRCGHRGPIFAVLHNG
jgi:hypothetical protein